MEKKNILQKATDVGKKAVSSVKESAKALSEKNKSDAYQKRLKKYNPLFPAEYFSDSFNVPNLIRIVDDAERKDVDVCNGAIGWLSKENDVEIFNVYDEFVKESGLKFIPAPMCDEMYYVDNFDKSRFIKLDYIFIKAHEEKLAELKHVAYMLGAKYCFIEISETDVESNKEKSKVSAGKNERDTSSLNDSKKQTAGKIIVEFNEQKEPEKPTLKWYAYDDNILRLVEMRCSNKDSVKSETIELTGASSFAISQKVANAIDGAVKKMKLKISSNMEKQALKEKQRKLIFRIEF